MPFSLETIAVCQLSQYDLSLTLCQQLIELFEGQIMIERDNWEGNSFYFSVKLSADPSTPPLHYSLKEGSPRGARVLLVDDNSTNLRVLELLCRKWGMLPVCVSDPMEVHDLLQQEADFDLAIVDYFMPHMNGLELSHLLRQRYPKASLPIVMLSSGAQFPEGGHDVLSAYLPKPVKQRHLLDSIGFCLNYRQHDTHLDCSKSHYMLRPGLIHDIRMLIAEDNAVGQKVALQILHRIGIKADVVQNGLEVLEAVKYQEYDLILMDIHMPLMDGLEACRGLHQYYGDSSARPVIIAMTVSHMQQDRQQGQEAGMDDYLPKPINLSSVGKMLHRWLPAAIMKK